MVCAVEMKNITKAFPRVIANKDIFLAVDWGSIHGLIGENGAGKTTLMRVLYGMYQPDAGEVFVNGEQVHFRGPADAIERGIGMVHQHFTLVPSLTVAQNIILGKPVCKRSGFLDLRKANESVKQLGIDFALPVDPRAVVKDLPVAMQQRVEILKVLYHGADIIIMDEPTATLTPQEVTGLLETLVLLKNRNKSVILITHKLKELMDVTDSITVLRHGKVTGRVKTEETTEKEVATLMVGREINFTVDKTPAKPSDTVLSVEKLNYCDRLGVTKLNDVSFSVHRGEIVGIAGVQGNGQSELIDAISGMITEYEGKINLGGTDIASKEAPLRRRRLGLGVIPEDRQHVGSALNASLTENFIMGDLADPQYSTSGHLSYGRAAKVAKKQFDAFDVRYASVDDFANSLSGGNLQKVIVSREFYRDPDLLIAAQPSRGVDIGATLFIHEKLVELRDNKKAVLLVSGELSEIMSLSDRILVMYNGTIVGETTPEKTTEEQIGLMMAGMSEAVSAE